jgi:DNA-binding NtrC family response regulator
LNIQKQLEMPTGDKIKILILDDEKQFTEELSDLFKNSDFESFEANTAAEGMKILRENQIDLLILDVRLHGISGLDILKEVKVLYPSMEVIIISAHGDIDTVIKSIRLGAFDYLRKPFRFIDIQAAIERTQKYLTLQRKLKRVEEKYSLISKSLEEKIDRHLIGASPQMLEVFEQAVTAANYDDANVLITGESGTGKENIARIIHYSSPRKDHVFCAVNSSAITTTLLESEFFGHKKGSFTGAVTDKMGFFEVCNQGTLFLDEIADMQLGLQAKILRAIEEKVITRVGDTNQIRTDFRIISATNQDIDKLVNIKTFRLDLFHRLNTIHIHIPPLRQRPEDIKPLLEHFIEHFEGKFKKPKLQVSSEVLDVLRQYDFPGNVRELKNMTERAIILCKSNTLGINDFPIKIAQVAAEKTDNDTINLQMLEISLIRKVLHSCKYNLQSAADQLGLHRDALSRRMKKYHINLTIHQQ